MKSEKHNSKLKLSILQIIMNFGYACRQMLRIYPLKFACQIFFWTSANLLSFFSNTYMLRFAVNGMQEGKRVEVILLYLLLMIVLNLAIDGARAVYDNLISPLIDRRCERRQNMQIYRRSPEIDLENYENPAAFEVYDRAVSNGAGAIGDVIGCIGSAVSTLLGVFMSAYLLIDIDPVLFAFVAVPWLFAPLRMLMQKKGYEYRVEQQRINRRKDYARRTFYEAEFAKEMRLTNIHRVMQRRFSDSVKEFMRLVKTKGLRIALVQELTSMGESLLSGWVVRVYSVYRTLVSGTMMYGDCLVAMNLVSELSSVANSITGTVSEIYSIALDIRDYRSFMETEPKVSPNVNGSEPPVGDIEFKNVSFRYDGASADALRYVNLKIRRGEHVAVVGHNGAGKTTLVKLLMRLYDPTDGEICVAGENIRNCKLREYRHTYGVVFQDYRQMAVTVAENVLGRPYRDSDEETVRRALEYAGIADLTEQLPDGIHTVMTREFDENGLILSGGQSQKLAIASIYARNALTVILDEPSSALDPIAERDMYDRMLAASVGKTVIFISHRLSSCVDADRVFYMENGTVAESGTHDQLMRLSGKYAEMFRMQAENYTDSVSDSVNAGGVCHA